METDFNWSPAISERARGTWFRHLTLQIFNQLWDTNTKGYEKGKGKGSTANWPLSGRNEFGYSNEGGKQAASEGIVNNKGIPKGESSQIERGEERER